MFQTKKKIFRQDEIAFLRSSPGGKASYVIPSILMVLMCLKFTAGIPAARIPI